MGDSVDFHEDPALPVVGVNWSFQGGEDGGDAGVQVGEPHRPLVPRRFEETGRQDLSDPRPCRTVAALGQTLLGYAQGAEQRRIWCSRHGRERCANTVSSQVRRRKTRCRWPIVSRIDHALGYGPK